MTPLEVLAWIGVGLAGALLAVIVLGLIFFVTVGRKAIKASSKAADQVTKAFDDPFFRDHRG